MIVNRETAAPSPPEFTNGKPRCGLDRRGFLRAVGATAGSVLFSPLQKRLGTGLASVGATNSRPHVILILVDALRADHTSANGYHRTTTPNLDDRLLNHGVSFTRARTPSPWTGPANMAIMTGYYPYHLNATWDHTVLPATIPTLAEMLHEAGYFGAGFVSNAFLSQSRGFSRGFDVYDDALAFNPTSFQGVAAALNGRVFSWLASGPPEPAPLFLFVYYVDPHTWYHPVPPFNTLYDETYTGNLHPEVYRDGQDVVADVISPSERDVEHLIALYDGETAYWDYYLGELLAELENQQLLDNSLVVVTADHGQAFGEHGRWTHGNGLYEEVLRVPLLVRYPGLITPGQTIDDPVLNMDLMPTILDFAGVQTPPGLHATSLRPILQQATPVLYRDSYAEIDGVRNPGHWAFWNAPRGDLCCIVRDDWKLIHHLDQPEADELYSLSPSPLYERVNQIATLPQLAAELRDALFERFHLPRHKCYLPYLSASREMER
jgi:arylsulfatase